MRMRPLMLFFGLLVLAVLLALTANAYLNRPGRFCHRNYERIQVGLTLAEVEALLGGPGEELRREQLPQSPDFSEPVLEKRVKPVVTGDQFFQWLAPENYNGGRIIVGLRDGRVCDKWYWEYSL